MDSRDIIPVLIFVIGAPLMIMAQIYLLVMKMSEPEKMIKPIAGGLSQADQNRLLQYRDWLASENLQLRTTFRFGPMQIIVFQHGDLPRYFLFNFHKRLTYGAESYLADLTVLDSTASNAIGLFPRPGGYAQSFPGITPQELWRRHLEGEAHLTAKFGYHWQPMGGEYEDILVDAARLRMQVVRSQSFWPARVLYRFFVTRPKLLNKTIAQQYP